jgi:hypothetical protein
VQLPIARSVNKNFSVFSLQILPHVVPIQDIIIDTQGTFSYTHPIKKQVLSAPSKLGVSCGVKVSIG